MRPGFGSAHLTRFSFRGQGFTRCAARLPRRRRASGGESPDGCAPEEASEGPAPRLGRRKSAGSSGPRAQPPRRRGRGARRAECRAPELAKNAQYPGDVRRAREPLPSPSLLSVPGKAAMAAAAASLEESLEARRPASKRKRLPGLPLRRALWPSGRRALPQPASAEQPEPRHPSFHPSQELEASLPPQETPARPH